MPRNDRVFVWVMSGLLVIGLVMIMVSVANAQPPFSKGDTGFVSGSFCNQEGHRKVMEALLNDYKTSGSLFPEVWDEQIEEKNCNTISETLVLTVDEIKYEGMTRFGEAWTIRHLVAGIVEIFTGWFEQGPQPEPMKFKGQAI